MPHALSALGSSNSLQFLFFSLGFALGTAPTAIVSRAFGAGDMDQVREANRKCFSIALYAGVIAVGLMLLTIPAAANFFTAEEATEVRPAMIQFLTCFAFALPALYLIQSLAGSLRAIGDTRSPLVISGIQIVLHIVLNYLLIFPTRNFEVWGINLTVPGADWGIFGAGISLTISAWIAVLGYIFWVARTPLGPSWNLRLPELEWVRRILKIAVPASMMSVVRVTGYMGLTKILTYVPQSEEAVGAMRAGFSIEAFAFMPAFGLMIAAQALVGQSLGMKDPDRASRLGWLAGHHSAVVSVVVSVLLIVFRHDITAFMLPNEPVIAAIAADYVFWIAVTEIFFGYGMVMSGAMQGAGDTVRPFWLSLVTLWGVRLPLAGVLALTAVEFGGSTLALLGMGATGVWISMSFSQTVQGIAAMELWRRGGWKTTQV